MTLNLEISDDKFLIKWFKENSNKICFIDKSKEYSPRVTPLKKSTKELIAELREGEPLHTPDNTEKLIDLWKNLLGDAIIFLKSKDTRERYHDGEIFGVDNLYKLLKGFKKFEKLLYGTSEYYRDHITHVFRVFILGEYLIRKNIKFDTITVFDGGLGKKISNEEKEAMWCIISLTHDLGYALETIDKINDNVREMIKQFGKASVQELTYLFPPQRQAIDDFVLKFISSNLEVNKEKKEIRYSTHIQSKYFLKFCNAFEKFDHGVISCTVLMRSLVYFLESDFSLDQNKFLDEDDARQFLIRQNILRSIAIHNCEEIYHLTGNNFPFLLTILDEFQEWGRPRMTDMFKQNAPEKKIIIKEFGKNSKVDMAVNYEVIFKNKKGISTNEQEKMSTEIEKWFNIKVKKYIKILRSAMGGELRNINLIFSVKDEIKRKNYKFILPQPATKDEQQLEHKIFLNDDVYQLQE
jgi:hypothetical protein